MTSADTIGTTIPMTSDKQTLWTEQAQVQHARKWTHGRAYAADLAPFGCFLCALVHRSSSHPQATSCFQRGWLPHICKTSCSPTRVRWVTETQWRHSASAGRHLCTTTESSPQLCPPHTAGCRCQSSQSVCSLPNLRPSLETKWMCIRQTGFRFQIWPSEFCFIHVSHSCIKLISVSLKPQRSTSLYLPQTVNTHCHSTLERRHTLMSRFVFVDWT